MNKNATVSRAVTMDDPHAQTATTRLCAHCGLCCDGTLFRRGRILAGDDFSYTEAWGVAEGRKGKGFSQPCVAVHNRICTIYPHRPQICGDYKCRLLRRFERGEIPMAEAMRIAVQTAEHAVKLRAALMAATQTEKGPMLDLYRRMKAMAPLSPETAPLFVEFAALQLSLDKHFREKQAFLPRR